MAEDKTTTTAPTPAPAPAWPIKGATIRLAHNLRLKEEGKDAPYYEPPTENGRVRLGMEMIIFLPSKAVQRIGFTPYKLEKKQKEGAAEGVMEDVPVDATRDLMAHYQGIYKRIE